MSALQYFYDHLPGLRFSVYFLDQYGKVSPKPDIHGDQEKDDRRISQDRALRP